MIFVSSIRSGFSVFICLTLYSLRWHCILIFDYEFVVCHQNLEYKLARIDASVYQLFVFYFASFLLHYMIYNIQFSRSLPPLVLILPFSLILNNTTGVKSKGVFPCQQFTCGALLWLSPFSFMIASTKHTGVTFCGFCCFFLSRIAFNSFFYLWYIVV